jgi:hypothetical protein
LLLRPTLATLALVLSCPRKGTLWPMLVVPWDLAIVLSRFMKRST